MAKRLLDVVLVGAVSKGVAGASQCAASTGSQIDLGWHAPNASAINDLGSVVNGTGVYGFIFNSSLTPATSGYSTYNWCNMPHVRPQEYVVPPSELKLEYVEVIHRHHKRTPYAANTFPRETYSWSCADAALFYYGTPRPDGTSAQINWQVATSDSNPLAPDGFNGSCQFPQISGQGLNDSRQHGQDLFDVYHGLLNFLPAEYDPKKVAYRVTNNVITSQVVGQVIEGQFPKQLTNAPIGVSIQPASIDSLEPAYTCATADTLRAAYGVGSHAANWTQHLNASAALFAKLDAVSGVNTTAPAWHNWFDHYFDNLSARLCHQKPLPCAAANSSNCITDEEAEAVFRAGIYEYSFIYRDAPQSLAASTAGFGIWMAELAGHLRGVVNTATGGAGDGGDGGILYRHNVAHDGSISRLLSILQLDVMVWPGMGSEVVFELYSRNACYFLRVLWGGQVLRSSNPSLGRLDLVPVQKFLDYVDGLVGVKAQKVPGLCKG
ncbi:uncharacterized protein A1O9_06504 [Exophiala aquamarina CBS 119918]|uniref:Acid phosphatase n=1 Tax=Exophiala aquamarina CBS 119918 TaxID=1182545 RepID=A0A072PGY9_9EURO|nr:uncharacterized protein A1O9_06504 [Exophiala aquamarina CBS 119918]KEF58578.1 hypothetical protein A1O9_06504 [Exophiala aquamarina CBS 119918]